MKIIFVILVTLLTSRPAFALEDIAQNSEGFINGFALSPDGKTVVYAKGNQVFAMRPDGSQKQQITGITTTASMGIHRIRFSPNSRYISFDIPSANQNEVLRDNFWVADLQTLKAIPLVTDIQNLMDARAYLFTGDSQYFIYPFHNGTNWIIKRYNLISGEARELINLTFNNDFFFVKLVPNTSAKTILIGLPQVPFMHDGFVEHSLLNWETGEKQLLDLPQASNRKVNVLGLNADASQVFYVQCESANQKFYSYNRITKKSTLLQDAPGCMLDWSSYTTIAPPPKVDIIQSYLFFNNYLNQTNSVVAGFYGLNIDTKKVVKISNLNADDIQLSKDQSHVFYSLSPAHDLTEFNFDLFYYSLAGQKATQYASPTTLPYSASLGYIMNPQENAVFLVRGAVGGPSSSPFIKAAFWKLSVNGPDRLLGEIDGHMAPNRDAARACAMDPQGQFVICNTVDLMNVGHLYKFAF